MQQLSWSNSTATYLDASFPSRKSTRSSIKKKPAFNIQMRKLHNVNTVI